LIERSNRSALWFARFDMDLVSQCALRVAQVVWRPGHGGFAFTVVCKATFELRPDVSPLAAVQVPVVFDDVYADEGAGLAVASDLVPAKKWPEVLLTGHAYAPEGRPVPSILARLVVGEIDKTIQVVGDRHFGRNGKLGDPEYFTGMSLGWERADGGPGTLNPAGRSLGSAARADALGRVPAPNLLPAGLRLRSRSDTVTPVGFGPIAPLWPSRIACLHQHAAGWDPNRWYERPLPSDIDLGYFNAAQPDQQRALPFGEEAIYLENLHPRFAQLSTRLAQVTPAATADYGSGPQALQLRCDTLTINTDSGLAMLVWRAHVLLDHPDRPGRVVVTVPAAALPFLPAAVVAPVPVAPARIEAIPRSSKVDTGDSTLTGFTLPVAALPFTVAPGESVARREAPHAESALALPFVSPSADEEGDGPVTPRRPDPSELTPPHVVSAPLAASWDSELLETLRPPAAVSSWDMPPVAVDRWRAPEFVAAPLPGSETPAPPLMIGPIAVVAEEVERAGAPDSAVAAVVEASAPEAEIDVEVYPPPRCGAIAARLAHARGEQEKTSEILRGEDLDPGRWQRVHAHWLERIREEAARSRKKLLSEYDSGYVGALEGERGAIGLEEYARLAEAAERGEAAAALAELGLPEGGWAHIHRVWIGRMVKDVRLGKQVRGAIEEQRSAG
jgi:hypothetical protein